MEFLKAVAVAALRCPITPPESAVSHEAACVAAALSDRELFSVLGGDAHSAWAVSSAHARSVVRCLSACLHGKPRRAIQLAVDESVVCGGVAATRDGAALLITDVHGGAIHVFRAADGVKLRSVGSWGRGPLQFRHPRHVWVAPDGVVYVADGGNKRVQALSQQLEFDTFVGVGHLYHPVGVCGNDAMIAVSESGEDHCISTYDRVHGAILRRFGTYGTGNGRLRDPQGICFYGRDAIAVADCGNDRISIYSADDIFHGDFIRHMGVGQLARPCSVACSDFGDLIVCNTAGVENTAVLSSDTGKVRTTLHVSALHVGAVSRSIFALDAHMRYLVF